MNNLIKKLGDLVLSKHSHLVDCADILKNPRRGFLLCRGCLIQATAPGYVNLLRQGMITQIMDLMRNVGYTVYSGKVYSVHNHATYCQLPAVIQCQKSKDLAALDIQLLDLDQFNDALKGGQRWIKDNAQIIMAMSGLSECVVFMLCQNTGQLAGITVNADEQSQITAYDRVLDAIKHPPKINDSAPKMLDCGPVYFALGMPCSVCCQNCYHGFYDKKQGWCCVLRDFSTIDENQTPCNKHIFISDLMPWPVSNKCRNEDGDVVEIAYNTGESGIIWNIPATRQAIEDRRFTSLELSRLHNAPALLADGNVNALRVNFGAVPVNAEG